MEGLDPFIPGEIASPIQLCSGFFIFLFWQAKDKIYEHGQIKGRTKVYIGYTSVPKDQTWQKTKHDKGLHKKQHPHIT